MRVLLDECVPRRLRKSLSEHVVRTVPEMGRSSFADDSILDEASGRFEAFVTTDQRLVAQQNISKFRIAVLVLVARRNKLEFLLPLLPDLRRALEQVPFGEFRRIEANQGSHREAK